MTVFSVQDETGTVAQLTLLASPVPAVPVAVGDVGIYDGIPDDGVTTLPSALALLFTVVQVLDPTHFSVNTRLANMADWPANGTITWQTGGNATATSTVTSIDGANAYISIDEFNSYHNSRGTNVATSPEDAALQAAIVRATDYLDQKYTFAGVKLLQSIGNAAIDANATLLESWLTPYVVNTVSLLTPTTSTQSTEFPRQGVTDLNGNTVNGIPKQIKQACAELALRVLNGVVLQPDYDPGLVGAGGIVQSVTKKIGPLETAITYDTKSGLGFFASFPQIDRMLSRGGLLKASGGRSVIR
jgi:hypothetical protein